MKFRKALFTVGLLLFLYPTISDWWNSFHQSQVISHYTDEIEQLAEEECEVFWNQAVEYNQRLKDDNFLVPLSDSQKKEYDSLLSMYRDGLMGYIEIPVIDVRLPIYHGTEEAVLQIGAGHMEGTSFPVGGENTHCILSGHRGLPSSRLFTGLDRLEIGDHFRINILNKSLLYEICKVQIVLPEETDSLTIEEKRELCTLVTCTPYGINTHRLVITGQRVEETEVFYKSKEAEEKSKGGVWMFGKNLAKWSIVLVLIGLFWFSSMHESHAAEVTVKNSAEKPDKVNLQEESVNYDIIIQYEFSDIEFKLYRIRTKIQGNNKVQKSNNNSKIDVEIKLSDYIENEPVQVQRTDEKGRAYFKGIEAGQYVIIGSSFEDDGYLYTPVMTQITLAAENNAIRTILINPKYERESKENLMEKPKEEMTDSMIPQTGQLWTPVFLFLSCGIMLMAMGWSGKK